jgi:hypothetical protein
MRVVNIFNFAVVLIAALFTWNAVAAEPMKVHVMQNVTTEEAADISHALVKLGYAPSEKTLFSESHDAIIITKALKNEHEPASLTIELVHLENDKEIPHTLFQYSLSGNDIHTMMKAFPKPDAFSLQTQQTMPVASNSQQ